MRLQTTRAKAAASNRGSLYTATGSHMGAKAAKRRRDATELNSESAAPRRGAWPRARCMATVSTSTFAGPSREEEAQSPAKSRKNGVSTIPYPQQERIKQGFIRGKSIRKLARIEHRDFKTVQRILRGADVKNYVERMRGLFYGVAEEAIETFRSASSIAAVTSPSIVEVHALSLSGRFSVIVATRSTMLRMISWFVITWPVNDPWQLSRTNNTVALRY